jgi:hypothetical protein
MLRRRAKVSFLLGSILLLTACEQTEVVTKNDLIDTAFVSTVREELGLPFISHDELIRIGKETCEDNDLFEAIEATKAKGLTESDAAYVVGAGWAAYCPENTDKYR